jgi:RNA polymerase sigma-70 factor (ECF subfamily)
MSVLARTYGPGLRRFFQRRILEHADVDDLVQDVFLHLARRSEVSDIDNPHGYVFQTAANILRDRLRKRYTRAANLHEPIADNQAEEAAFSPERLLLGREAISVLTRALLELPERTRAVFFLSRIEGLPYAHVGRRLGISLRTVNNHMTKATEHLQGRMKDQL